MLRHENLMKGCVINLGVVLWRMGKQVLCIVNFILLSEYGESQLKIKLHKRGLCHEFKGLCHEFGGRFVEGGKESGTIDHSAIQCRL